MGKADWIAADWGAKHLRLWAMRDADVIAARQSDQGAADLTSDQFAQVLAQETADWRAGDWAEAPVVACGEVGGRQGWVEAPYSLVPTKAQGPLIQVRGQRVWIACGMRQEDPSDVMRGEETQIAGLLAARPKFDGVVCLLGAQSKWARISAEELCHFQSFMTAELYAFLTQQSALAPSLATQSEALDEVAFDRAVEEALAQPHRAYGRLFQLRAGELLGAMTAKAAASRLSGLLIGWELASAKPYWLGEEVVLIGAPEQMRRYGRALTAQGVTTREADAEAVMLAGLHRAWKSLASTA